MGNFTIIEHPIVQAKMSKLRSTSTSTKEFREIVEEVATLVCYEATRNVPLVDDIVQTPICTAKVKVINKKFALVPIMRAGLGMVNGIISLIPNAKVGHIGLYRDPETHKANEYYCKLPPDVSERVILLLDPMLATGNTSVKAIQSLVKEGLSCKNIKFLCLLSCPEGLARINKEFPEIDIYTAAHDERLNEHGYIVPGLGDAGDRLYGTK